MKPRDTYVINEILQNYSGYPIEITIKAPRDIIPEFVSVNLRKIREINSRGVSGFKDLENWSDKHEK